MSKRIDHLKAKFGSAVHSKGGRNFMLYLLFVLVAFAFWMMLSLDSEVQKDYDIPLQLVEVPDSVTILSDVPQSLSVNVKAKGSQLLRFSWGTMPALKLDFRNYASADGRMSINKAKLDARVRDYFGTGVSIVTVRPDTLSILYTLHPGTRVKLRVVADLKTNLQCIISGPIKTNVDSVMVFTANGAPAKLDFVETEPLVKKELKDTCSFTVKIKPVNGMKIVPSTVTVFVPVEPLISKKLSVPLEVINIPKGEEVLTFPSKIEVSYLVPISSFNEDYPVRAYVDYKDTFEPGDKVPVTLGILPANYHNVSVSPDSVEYLIERTGK